MLRMGGGTISAKTGLLQAGAGQAMKTPITVSTAPYMVTTLGLNSSGRAQQELGFHPGTALSSRGLTVLPRRHEGQAERSAAT
jgi:hypothetical protein